MATAGPSAAVHNALAMVSQSAESQVSGDMQPWHGEWTAVAAKQFCAGATHTSTKANRMPVAIIRRCFRRLFVKAICPKPKPKQ